MSEFLRIQLRQNRRGAECANFPRTQRLSSPSLTKYRRIGHGYISKNMVEFNRREWYNSPENTHARATEPRFALRISGNFSSQPPLAAARSASIQRK
jgi:hypothetical protein